MTADKMICPTCGLEMNHHCDKLVYNRGSQETADDGSDMCGVIAEFHTCPGCGGSASRGI